MDDFKIIFFILIGVLPILTYVIYIYFRDEYKPEPIITLFIAATLGCITSYILAFLFYDKEIFPSFYPYWEWSKCWDIGFTKIALPSEVSKFIVLQIFLFFNKDNDEHIDGIIYSVCIALGFLFFQNYLFLEHSKYEWYINAVIIIFIFIPAHYTYGVLMGYFTALSRWKNLLYLLPTLVIPTFVHGLYSSVFLWIDFSTWHNYYIIIFLALIISAFILHLLKEKSIEKLLTHDIDLLQ